MFVKLLKEAFMLTLWSLGLVFAFLALIFGLLWFPTLLHEQFGIFVMLLGIFLEFFLVVFFANLWINHQENRRKNKWK